MATTRTSPQLPVHDRRTRDPYRAVVLVLLGGAVLGTIGAYVAGGVLANPVLLDAAVTLGLAVGTLTGIVVAEALRTGRSSTPVAAVQEHRDATVEPLPPDRPPTPLAAAKARLSTLIATLRAWRAANAGDLDLVRVGVAAAGTMATTLMWRARPPELMPQLTTTGVVVAFAACLIGVGLVAMTARYLGDVDRVQMKEAQGLQRGARVLAWILGAAALSVALSWAQWPAVVQVLHAVVSIINLAWCYGLFVAKGESADGVERFPVDVGVLATLGHRANILGSLLDAGERQLGIDLRSTWALTVVRRGIGPMVVALCGVGWLSTAVTIVQPEEQGLVEHWGVPSVRPPLEPGPHLHWPWPADRVFRIPVRRIQVLTVGHEGQEQEDGGPENVLWAVQHAAREYTLVLGNGRDLITVDAAVQFRIADVRAWHYHARNPGGALRAIAYRAVMRNTVNRTLAEALSENVVTMAARIRANVQEDADALRLGVEVLGFTVGGMHPPVMVAADYQRVVSAELGKVTAIVDAQAFRNRALPAAETSVLAESNRLRAEGANARATAAGEAWSFRTLATQYRLAPREYVFRRRLETLEKGLAGRNFIVVDSRIPRDGGELWLVP